MYLPYVWFTSIIHSFLSTLKFFMFVCCLLFLLFISQSFKSINGVKAEIFTYRSLNFDGKICYFYIRNTLWTSDVCFVCYFRCAFAPDLTGFSSMMLIWAAGARCKWRVFFERWIEYESFSETREFLYYFNVSLIMISD